MPTLILMTSNEGEHFYFCLVSRVQHELKWIFQPEGEDDLKKMQLMELAILNGTYRDAKLPIAIASVARKLNDEFHTRVLII